MTRNLNHILYKIGFTLVICLWSTVTACAQTKMNISKTDTIYYNFYNDAQMIEIIYSFPPSLQAIAEYDRRASMMNSIPPPPKSYHFSVYIFRNRQGEIVSVFNQKKEKIHQSDFIPVAELKENLATHIPNYRKNSILEFHNNTRYFIRTWDYLNGSSSPRPFEFHTIYDLNSIPNKQLPKDFTKLENEEHTLLISSRKGMIDTLGNVVLNPIYDKIIVYDSVLLLTKDEKYSFFSREAKSLSIEYDQYKLLPTNPSIFAVKSNNLWGFVNQSGKLVVDFLYENIDYPPLRGYSLESKFIKVLKNNKLGLIDTSFNEVFPIEFSSITVYNLNKRDFFVLTKDEKMGVFNDKLKPIIPMQYERVFHSQGMNTFLVKENEKWGVIDLEGRILFPTEYLIVGVQNTTYTIHKDNKYGIYDIYMNAIYPIELDGNLQYVFTYDKKHSFYYIIKDGKKGIYNCNEKTLVEPKYDKIEFRSPYFYAYLNDKEFILDTEFKKVKR